MTTAQSNLGSAQNQPSKSVEIIFYTHQDCHLCDDMEGQLSAFIANIRGQIIVDVLMRDIEDHAHWYKCYHEYVPVLVVNDEEVCHYFLDSDELMSALTKATNPLGNN